MDQWQRQEFSSEGAIVQRVWGTEDPAGSRGEAPVGGLGMKSPRSWIKQFADIVYRFCLQKRSTFLQFSQFTFSFLTSMFHGGGISDILGRLAPVWPRHCRRLMSPDVSSISALRDIWHTAISTQRNATFLAAFCQKFVSSAECTIATFIHNSHHLHKSCTFRGRCTCVCQLSKLVHMHIILITFSWSAYFDMLCVDALNLPANLNYSF